MHRLDWNFLIFLFILSLWSRWYQLQQPNKVSWDEVHFAKYAAQYLRHEMHFDVHPPLGKLLIALAGHLFGMDASSFQFVDSATYPDDVPYVHMRMFIATFGACLPVVAWLTAYQFGMSGAAASLVALLVLFDNALVSVSRLMLLEGPMLFFIALSLLSLSGLYAHRQAAFGWPWWCWLFLQGIALGAVVSIKFYGLVTVLYVGLYTFHELYVLYDTERWGRYVAHWVARIIALIIVPLGVFYACFAIHFHLLAQAHDFDIHKFSSLLQASLEGSGLISNPPQLSHYSTVSVRNAAWEGNLLHATEDVYVAEAVDIYQVTGTYHFYWNSEWQIRPYIEHEEEGDELPEPATLLPLNAQPVTAEETVAEAETEPLQHDPLAQDDDAPVDLQPVKMGDAVQFIHLQTNRLLSVPGAAWKHTASLSGLARAAFLVGTLQDVRGYGRDSTKWILQPIDNTTAIVEPVLSQFRLYSEAHHCWLVMDAFRLPQWGSFRDPVFCATENALAVLGTSHAIWNIESANHPTESINDERIYPVPSLLDRIVEVCIKMYVYSREMVPDTDPSNTLFSKPWQWPLLLKPHWLTVCKEGDQNMHLLGNPLVWWMAAASLVLFALMLINMDLLFTNDAPDTKQFQTMAWWIVGGWALHYVPFYFIARVLFLHHYLPALYFSLFVPPYVMEFVLLRLGLRHYRNAVMVAVAASVVSVFWMFADLSYGMRGTNAEYEHLQWLESWKLTC